MGTRGSWKEDSMHKDKDQQNLIHKHPVWWRKDLIVFFVHEIGRRHELHHCPRCGFFLLQGVCGGGVILSIPDPDMKGFERRTAFCPECEVVWMWSIASTTTEKNSSQEILLAAVASCVCRSPVMASLSVHLCMPTSESGCLELKKNCPDWVQLEVQVK